MKKSSPLNCSKGALDSLELAQSATCSELPVAEALPQHVEGLPLQIEALPLQIEVKLFAFLDEMGKKF